LVQVGHGGHEGHEGGKLGVDGLGGRSSDGGGIGLKRVLLLFLLLLLPNVVERDDLLGALISPHLSVAILENLSEDNGLVGCHVEAIGKCLIIKWHDALLVNF